MIHLAHLGVPEVTRGDRGSLVPWFHWLSPILSSVLTGTTANDSYTHTGQALSPCFRRQCREPKLKDSLAPSAKSPCEAVWLVIPRPLTSLLLTSVVNISSFCTPCRTNVNCRDYFYTLVFLRGSLKILWIPLQGVIPQISPLASGRN